MHATLSYLLCVRSIQCMSCGRGLEQQTAHFLLFLDKDLIDDGHSQQDTCTTVNGTWREEEEERKRERDCKGSVCYTGNQELTHEVSQHRELQYRVHQRQQYQFSSYTMLVPHHHLLVLEPLSNLQEKKMQGESILHINDSTTDEFSSKICHLFS